MEVQVQALDGVRVVDITDEHGVLAGRILADFGADVIRVEPPEGSGARRHPPFHPIDGRSMWWEVYAAGTRSVVVRPDAVDDEARLDTLIADAQVLMCSPSACTALRRDPRELAAAHPHLVVTVVSPFGLDGPKTGWPSTDLTVWAAGGPLEPHRDQAGVPIRPSVPQAALHGAADAAAGALLALRVAERDGIGQLVDVSEQASVSIATLGRVLAHPVGDDAPEWAGERPRLDRSGSGSALPSHLKKWPCKDGLIELHLAMGTATGAFTNNFFRWMHLQGACDDDLAAWDWRTVPERLERGELSEADLQRARHQTAAFLADKTKAQVLDAAIDHRLLCVGINEPRDLLESPQLAARSAFVDIGDGPGRRRIPRLGALVDGAPLPVRAPAPELGAHTDEVLRGAERPIAPANDRPGVTDPVGAGGTPAAPLADVRVLDLSWVVAGPLVGRALADFGAEVIRVESRRRTETARLMQPFYGGVNDPERSALFGTCNAGKRGLSVDLTTEAGRELVRELASRCDVVLESFAPGRLERWGLSPATLREAHPRLIVCSSSVLGQTGPHAGLAGFGNIGGALSGFQDVVGHPDELPIGPFGPYTDYTAPRIATAAVLAALRRRDRTGQGAHIDISQVETGVLFLGAACALGAAGGTPVGRIGNRDDTFVPHGVFRCADEDGVDRYLAVAVVTAEQWRALATVIGRRDLAEDPALLDASGRRAIEADLEAAVADWTRRHPVAEAEAALVDASVPAHRAASSRDVAEDPQLRARGHLVTVPDDTLGEVVVEGPRYRLSRTPGGPRTAAPRVGAHTHEVLLDLGIGNEQVEALVAVGALT